MVHYTKTEVHNAGIGEDIVWYNVKIWDVTKEQLDEIMKIVRPMYEAEMKVELEAHEKYVKDNERKVVLA